ASTWPAPCSHARTSSTTSARSSSASSARQSSAAAERTAGEPSVAEDQAHDLAELVGEVLLGDRDAASGDRDRVREPVRLRCAGPHVRGPGEQVHHRPAVGARGEVQPALAYGAGDSAAASYDDA